MAALLAIHHAQYGDWRQMFTTLDDLNKVTPDAVQRVARKIPGGHRPDHRLHVAPGANPAWRRLRATAGRAQDREVTSETAMVRSFCLARSRLAQVLSVLGTDEPPSAEAPADRRAPRGSCQGSGRPGRGAPAASDSASRGQRTSASAPPGT